LNPQPTVFTVGHGARPLETLIETLRAAGVRRLVDVRTAPGSRKHPQFGRVELEAALLGAGVEYVWRKDLGGWRKPRPDSRHSALRSPGFRGYADHMETPEFETAVGWLIDSARQEPTVFMCAESLWWRCHRRMLADALIARGCTVIHLLDHGRRDPHRLHPAARIVGTQVVYDRDDSAEQRLA
jgi:uncharacterized protein (DUF488 family)